MSCAHCRAVEEKFGRKIAQRDRRRYARRGPDPTTRAMLSALGGLDPDTATLLDVGGGIGMIPFELLGKGITAAVLVEAASAYLEVAGKEAETRGHAARMRFLHGDFVEMADHVPEAEVVTLDRVVCCYPDYQRLLTASAAKCRRFYALSYPRDRWSVRLVVALQNFLRRLVRDPFRTFVHPTSDMHRILDESGLSLMKANDTWVWRVALYERRGKGASGGRVRPKGLGPV